jgi:hypothetical protein
VTTLRPTGGSDRLVQAMMIDIEIACMVRENGFGPMFCDQPLYGLGNVEQWHCIHTIVRKISEYHRPDAKKVARMLRGGAARCQFGARQLSHART